MEHFIYYIYILNGFFGNKGFYRPEMQRPTLSSVQRKEIVWNYIEPRISFSENGQKIKACFLTANVEIKS